jgi:hypothetical protein
LVLNATTLTVTPHHKHALALRYDFHRAQYRSELLERGTAPDEVSVVTHCDVDGFARHLPELAKHWRGPMVVAVSVTARTDVHVLRQALLSPTLAKYAPLPRRRVPHPPLTVRALLGLSSGAQPAWGGSHANCV